MALKKPSGNNQVLMRWLKDRQQLIVSYAGLAEKLHSANAGDFHEDLDEFAGGLVDYLCEGHFEVFELLKAKSKHLSQINHTTDIAMAFHDKYLAGDGEKETPDRFARDLSKLGEALSVRFDLEDKLI